MAGDVKRSAGTSRCLRFYGVAVTEAESTLDLDDEDLVAAARRTIDDHGDHDLHTVAAAVRDERGAIHVGVNLYHFTGGPCPELVALANARAAGAREPQTIVAVGDDGRGLVAPCGRDRQVMADYYPRLRVLLPTPQGARAVRADALLPHTYRWQAEQVRRLRFRSTHLSAVTTGTKRCTIRFNDPVQVGPALLVFELAEPVTLPGRIMSTVAKKVSEITDEEAHADGFAGAADVLPQLRDYYPDLTGDDDIVIVSFEVDRARAAQP